METKKQFLKLQITEAMKTALKAQDKPRLATIRLIYAAIKQREVDTRLELNNTEIISILHKMIKQRRDSISQYQAGGRQDLADQEAFEINIIQAYVPAPISETEIIQLIKAAIVASNAKNVAELGKVMAILKPKLQGYADLSVVSQQVKAVLSQ